jgi:hypothetical protein
VMMTTRFIAWVRFSYAVLWMRSYSNDVHWLT